MGKMRTLGRTVAAMVLMGSSAWAFGCGCGMAPGPRLTRSVASDLTLTDDQKVLIQSRQEAFAEEITPLRSELFGKREELRQLWASANPDGDKITAKQQEVQEIRGRILEKATQYWLDCRQVLNPEQQTKLANMTCSRSGSGGGHGWGMRGWCPSFHIGKWPGYSPGAAATCLPEAV